jgi:hypothetical protein
LADRALDALGVVPNLDLEVAIDPGGGELLADPSRIAVDDVTEQELSTNRNHLATHARLLEVGLLFARRSRTGLRRSR